MSGPDVRALLSALESAGVGVALNVAGDGLTLSGKGQPPLSLLEAVRASKPALLEALTAKEDAPTSLPSPNPQPRRLPDGRLDVAYLASLPGRCGNCARWTPTPYPLEGECSAGRQAHGWYDGEPSAPVLTHPGHVCGAHEGKGYRARGIGKQYGPRPPLPLPPEPVGAA